MIIKVETVAELDNLILHSSALVMDFFADWCGPCKNLGKFLEKIKDQDEFKNVVFCKVNVDIAEFENICAKCDLLTLDNNLKNEHTAHL